MLVTGTETISASPLSVEKVSIIKIMGTTIHIAILFSRLVLQ